MFHPQAFCSLLSSKQPHQETKMTKNPKTYSSLSEEIPSHTIRFPNQLRPKHRVYKSMQDIITTLGALSSPIRHDCHRKCVFRLLLRVFPGLRHIAVGPSSVKKAPAVSIQTIFLENKTSDFCKRQPEQCFMGIWV